VLAAVSIPSGATSCAPTSRRAVSTSRPARSASSRTGCASSVCSNWSTSTRRASWSSSRDFFGHVRDLTACRTPCANAAHCCSSRGRCNLAPVYEVAGRVGADIATARASRLGLPLSLAAVGGFDGVQIRIRPPAARRPSPVRRPNHDGRRGFVLTCKRASSTFGREKATSNIRTSQTLLAWASRRTCRLMAGWAARGGTASRRQSGLRRAAHRRPAWLPGDLPAVLQRAPVRTPHQGLALQRELVDKKLLAGVADRRRLSADLANVLLWPSQQNTRAEMRSPGRGAAVTTETPASEHGHQAGAVADRALEVARLATTAALDVPEPTISRVKLTRAHCACPSSRARRGAATSPTWRSALLDRLGSSTRSAVHDEVQPARHET